VTDRRLAALLQPIALPQQVRREIRGTPVLAGLRAALIGPQRHPEVSHPPRLQRLRLRTVISVLGATVAAYLLATQLPQVNIGHALASAEPGWLAMALVGSAVTCLGPALALQAFLTVNVPLARTVSVQLASSFVSLITPPAVGYIGLNIRYLHQAGVPSQSPQQVAVKESVTIAVTVPLVVICGWLSGASGSHLTLLPSGTVLTIGSGALIIAAPIALAPPPRGVLRR